MTSPKHPLLLTVGVIISFIIFVLLFGSSWMLPQAKVAYVDNVTLFNEFKMTKELLKAAESRITKQQQKLDSLYTIYNGLAKQQETQKENLESQLRLQDQELKALNTHIDREIQSQVWNTLNAYMQKYGEQHDYEMIFGARGDGSIMYARHGADITAAVIEYANTQYENKAND